MMRVVLVAPQIPPNTGSVGRMCAGNDIPLHLVEPLGFSLTDKYLKRAGLDYWPHIDLSVHPSFDEVSTLFPTSPCWFFSARAERTLWDVSFGGNELLVFGSETKGLPADLIEGHQDRILTIPHNNNIRSLNLATAVAIVTYEVFRQTRGIEC
jgi:tRNA (cytidine/uridine-2'-O-)-methyltransferase